LCIHHVERIAPNILLMYKNKNVFLWWMDEQALTEYSPGSGDAAGVDAHKGPRVEWAPGSGAADDDGVEDHAPFGDG
jgi:hypothetical protein